MKRSSPSLQFLAAAASTDATTTLFMYSRPPYGGGRNQWRREFVSRPQGDDRNQFVTGDSHFQSVRDANRGFRHVERENFANHMPFQPQRRPPPFNYRPPFNPYPQPFNQNQHFRPSPPPQQFRPRAPKPLDYRNWEYATPGLPAQSERFTILSYNILADYLATNHRNKLYFHIPHHILDWEFRKRNIIFELGLWSADILCFQEVDRFEDLEEELKIRGYRGIWKMRTGDPVDGCAIFWRISRFKLLHEEFIEFSKIGLRDNVAQICVLESMNQNHNKCASAIPASSTGSNKVVICNIHVLYNPKRGEIKLGQVRVLLDRAYAVSKLWDDAPVVLCGDFNCTPKSPLYNFISEQKLNLSELPRDKLSGQASAEICASRPYTPNLRAHSADNSAPAPRMVDGREVGQSDTPLDMQKQNDLDGNSENIPLMSGLSQPECINTVLNVSVSSCIKRQHEHEKIALSYELMKRAHQGKEDVCKDETERTVCVSVSCLSERSSSSHNGQGCSVDPMKDGIHDFSPVKNRANANASCGSSSEHTPSNFAENKSLYCERGTGYNYSTDATIHPEPASTINSGVPLSKLSHKTSFSDVPEVSYPGNSEILSSLSATNVNDWPSTSFGVGVPYKSTTTNTVVDEKMESLSLNEPDEATEDETLGEDSTTFLSELHNTNGGFPSDFSQFPRSEFVACNDSSEERLFVPHSQQLHHSSAEALDNSPGMDYEPVNVVKTAYDPSVWTPMEIETATGNSDCTLMEHALKLSSTYSEVEDCSGTRDSNGEPVVTSYNRCFFGTVDYIWRSEGLQTVRVLAPIPRHAMQWTPGFPTKKWGSDHIALVSELAFT